MLCLWGGIGLISTNTQALISPWALLRVTPGKCWVQTLNKNLFKRSNIFMDRIDETWSNHAIEINKMRHLLNSFTIIPNIKCEGQTLKIEK